MDGNFLHLTTALDPQWMAGREGCWCKLSAEMHNFSELHFDNPFQGYPTCPPFMSPDTEHLAPENPGARCRHLAPGTSPKPGKWGIPEKCLQNAVWKCLFQVASAPQSKVMAQT